MNFRLRRSDLGSCRCGLNTKLSPYAGHHIVRSWSTREYLITYGLLWYKCTDFQRASTYTCGYTCPRVVHCNIADDTDVSRLSAREYVHVYVRLPYAEEPFRDQPSSSGDLIDHLHHQRVPRIRKHSNTAPRRRVVSRTGIGRHRLLFVPHCPPL